VTAAATTAETEEDHPGPSWTHWFTIGSIALAAVAFVATVWSVGPHQLGVQLAAIGWGFAAVIVIEAAATACDSAALSGFLGDGGRRPTYWRVLHAQVMGRAINAVTPLASLGEATKATALMRRTSSKRAIGAVIRYNLVSVGMKLAVIAIGAPMCALFLDTPGWLEHVLLIGGGVAVLLLLAGAWLVAHGMLATGVSTLRSVRILSRERTKRWLAEARGIDGHLRGAPNKSLFERWAPAAWVALARTLNLFTLWVVIFATGTLIGPGTMGAIASAGPIISLASSLVPLGLGISEAGNAALFLALHEPTSLGVAMVLGSRIATLAYAAIGLALIVPGAVLEFRR
jgi:hypothetical protein